MTPSPSLSLSHGRRATNTHLDFVSLNRGGRTKMEGEKSQILTAHLPRLGSARWFFERKEESTSTDMPLDTAMHNIEIICGREGMGN
jgi:hypothetical protein